MAKALKYANQICDCRKNDGIIDSDFKGIEFDSFLYEVGNNLIILKKHAQKTYISGGIYSVCIGNFVHSVVRKSISRIEY
jgi:hypothetical protein